jgi:hypothetical protein
MGGTMPHNPSSPPLILRGGISHLLVTLFLSPLKVRGDEGGLLFLLNIPYETSQIGYRFS